jgi:hypothetical protein
LNRRNKQGGEKIYTKPNIRKLKTVCETGRQKLNENSALSFAKDTAAKTNKSNKKPASKDGLNKD